MPSNNDLSTFSNWTEEDKDLFTVAVIKGLIMDTVRNANSGHTGGPMSSADFSYLLFSKYMNFDPDNSEWFNRDRFILSAGHESALLYTLLTLIGWLKIDDLQQFRQLHSKTPGHPEVEIEGVEATTGPLGQGVAMGIGMAVAEEKLRNIFSQKANPKTDPISHYNYILASDGDMQEPVATGAAALAGHWGLSKVIMFYDSNDAQISGNVSRSDSSDYGTIFDGYGWHVQEINGHDHKQICSAIEKAQVVNKPSIIIGKTIMAYGAVEMEEDHETQGAPLSKDEIKALKYEKDRVKKLLELGYKVIVYDLKKPKISHKNLTELEDNLLLFFTGYSRNAGDILKEQDKKTKQEENKMIDNLNFVKKNGLVIFSGNPN